MISEKLSVGPSQVPGEFDRLSVPHKDSFKEKNIFEDILKKKDNEFRETSGGTNRKMLERRIEKNPKRLSDKTEKDEKEQQPTSNPMAFQQSRVEVVDSDKNPDRESSSSDVSDHPANKKLESVSQILNSSNMNTLQDEDEALLQQIAAGLTKDSASASNAEVAALVGEETVHPFQADVFQALQQSQQEFSALAKETALSTKDLSESLDSEVVQPTPEGFGQQLNADEIQAQLAKTMESNSGFSGQNEQSQQFDQSFAMNSSQNKIDSKNADHQEEFKFDDQAIDSLKDSSVNAQGLPTHAVGQNASSFQSSGSTAPLGIDKPNAQMNENTSEIVKQAEFLVKDGGGTAKIRMTPEGMGTVDLRVTMNDGKVQVELNTADPQAKKLLQESITDLRSSLASHNFNLDHVKINNMSAMTDLSQQNSNSQSFLNQHDSGRNQNWNQFEGNFGQQQRQGNQSQDSGTRSAFFRPDTNIQTESQRQTFAAPKITRGYGMAAKSSTLSQMNVVA